MADYNLVVVCGRAKRDPVLKYSAKTGNPYTRLLLDVNRQRTLPDGTLKQSQISVTVFVQRHQAEIVAQFVKKGSSVLVSGALEEVRRTGWENGHEVTRTKLRVRASRIQFLDKAKVEGGAK